MDGDVLDEFYNSIRQRIPVSQFSARYEAIFPFIHAAGLTPQLRAARGRLKKLRDEVDLVATLLRHQPDLANEVAFSLSSEVPDVCLWKNGIEYRTELTTTFGLARHYLVGELNRRGFGRGFIPIIDGANKRVFEHATASEGCDVFLPTTYSTDQYTCALTKSVARCLKKKDRDRHSAWLIIGAPIGIQYIPRDVIGDLMPSLSTLAASTNFSRVFVVDKDLAVSLKD